MIRFNKHHVTNGTEKARVHYHLDNRTDRRACVTLYAKDYASGRALGAMFDGSYTNDTDLMTDYFDKGRAVLLADHPLYAAARVRAEANAKADDDRIAARAARDDPAASLAPDPRHAGRPRPDGGAVTVSIDHEIELNRMRTEDAMERRREIDARIARDGGPAFPRIAHEDPNGRCAPDPGSEGMALRDYFATHALAALIHHRSAENAKPSNPPCWTFDTYAAESYRFADAMVKARWSRLITEEGR